ncbi:MAG: response regulator [Deltaproteobacteria bacterium]|nr:response regulator [Deltaproteobacteria bacterium]
MTEGFLMDNQRCVLVVDDEPVLLELLDACLSEDGFRVERATNGLEAIKMAEAKQYHAIITDVRMPVMDGVNFYKRLCATSPHLCGRVIFISGHLSQENESFIKTTGRPFLLKPFQIKHLSEAIESLTSAVAERVMENDIF